MLRMSKNADYGLVLLSELAQTGAREGEGTALSARDLAEQTGLPQPTVAKILKRLARAEILVSQRGVHGGYQMTRRAAELSVAAILEALDGPIAMVDCTPDTDRSCDHESCCPVRSPLQRLNGIVRDTLDSVTLGELVSPDLIQIPPFTGSRR